MLRCKSNKIHQDVLLLDNNQLQQSVQDFEEFFVIVAAKKECLILLRPFSKSAMQFTESFVLFRGKLLEST